MSRQHSACINGDIRNHLMIGNTSGLLAHLIDNICRSLQREHERCLTSSTERRELFTTTLQLFSDIGENAVRSQAQAQAEAPPPPQAQMAPQPEHKDNDKDNDKDKDKDMDMDKDKVKDKDNDVRKRRRRSARTL